MTIPIPAPKAIIFDWDDTLVDTWRVVRGAFNTTLAAMGQPEWTEEEARRRIGPPARVIFTELFGAEKWEAADKIYFDAYVSGIADGLRAHDGIGDILQAAADRGIYLAVVSTKRGPLLRQEAKHLGVDHYFKQLVGAGDALRDKPDAEAVRKALEGSGIAPRPDVWFVGDSQTDMICAANAGCLPILIETKLPSAEALAKNPPAYRFKTHKEFMDFLGTQVR